MKAVRAVTALSAGVLSDRVSDALYELESAGMDVLGLASTGTFVHTVIITYDDNQPWDARVAAYERRHNKLSKAMQLVGGLVLLTAAIWIALSQVHRFSIVQPYQVIATIALLAAGSAFIDLVSVILRLSVTNLALYLITSYVGSGLLQRLLPNLNRWLGLVVAVALTTTIVFGTQEGIADVKGAFRRFRLKRTQRR